MQEFKSLLDTRQNQTNALTHGYIRLIVNIKNAPNSLIKMIIQYSTLTHQFIIVWQNFNQISTFSIPSATPSSPMKNQYSVGWPIVSNTSYCTTTDPYLHQKYFEPQHVQSNSTQPLLLFRVGYPANLESESEDDSPLSVFTFRNIMYNHQTNHQYTLPILQSERTMQPLHIAIITTHYTQLVDMITKVEGN